MSDDYTPDHDATAGDPWDIAFLSDRDVSGQVPINFVSHPGVYLTPACFGNGTYEDVSFRECFSNLLASEFRRFIIDLYWDATNRVFSLCPVELPAQNSNDTAQADLMSFMSNFVINANQTSSTTSHTLTARQAVTSNSTSANTTEISNTANSTATATATSAVSIPTIISASGTTLYQLGPYQCSDTLDFEFIISLLLDYVSLVKLTVDARLQFMIINLHAASSIETPTTPKQSLSGSELPSSTELLSNSMDAVQLISYSPTLLVNDRGDLNNSWFSKSTVDYYPILKFFTVNRLANGILSTPDGWPCENYLQLQQGQRFLFSYGTVDSSIEDYDFSGDNGTIFMPGYLTSEQNVILDDSGSLTSGCFYNSTSDQVGQTNSSWATFAISDVDQSVLGFVADNLTVCGISPILNYTLSNSPASVAYEPYQGFANQALFSWASGEPENATAAGQNADVPWSCALMVADDAYKGHWRAFDCTQKYRVACREANLPYAWRLSDDTVSYYGGNDACTGNSSFDVPRTGLENTYLYHRIQSMAATQQDSSLLDGVWINFNSINNDACWVTTGANGTCPYRKDEDAIRQRTILVPTIAAFIVLCITALTLLVKCNSNRKKGKVRKRGEGGWDYEGVPS